MIVYGVTFLAIGCISATILLLLTKKRLTMGVSPLTVILILCAMVSALLTFPASGNWIEALTLPTGPVIWIAAFFIYMCAPSIRTALGRTTPLLPWSRERTFLFEGRRFILALPLIAVVLAGIIATTAVSIRGMKGALAWNAGQRAIQEKRGTAAYGHFTRAITANPYISTYRIGISQLSLALAIELAASGSANQQDMTNAAALVEQAIREAKVATELNPTSVAAWTNAGQIYERLTPYSSEAQSWADAAYAKAKSLKK